LKFMEPTKLIRSKRCENQKTEWLISSNHGKITSSMSKDQWRPEGKPPRKPDRPNWRLPTPRRTTSSVKATAEERVALPDTTTAAELSIPKIELLVNSIAMLTKTALPSKWPQDAGGTAETQISRVIAEQRKNAGSRDQQHLHQPQSIQQLMFAELKLCKNLDQIFHQLLQPTGLTNLII
jgi:hypothetical protein